MRHPTNKPKLVYLQKLLSTQTVVTVNDQEIFDQEGKKFMEKALSSFEPSKGTKDEFQVQKRKRAIEKLTDLNSTSYKNMVEFAKKLV